MKRLIKNTIKIIIAIVLCIGAVLLFGISIPQETYNLSSVLTSN